MHNLMPDITGSNAEGDPRNSIDQTEEPDATQAIPTGGDSPPAEANH